MRSAMDRDLMRILLVEDNAGDALLVQEAFQETGTRCDFTVATDGELALALLQGDAHLRPIDRPDLILLDLNLPRKDGYEVLRDLKSCPVLRSIPVIVLTSSGAERDVAMVYTLHGNAYFRKSSSFGEYVQLATTIVDFWRQAERSAR